MSFQITGQVTFVGEPTTRNEFTYREFTISVTENGYIKPYFFQVSGQKINLVTPSLMGKEIEVKFNINCRENAGKQPGTTFKSTNLTAWAVSVIERARVNADTPPPPPAPFLTTQQTYGPLGTPQPVTPTEGQPSTTTPDGTTGSDLPF